jgi:hypothetical protein
MKVERIGRTGKFNCTTTQEIEESVLNLKAGRDARVMKLNHKSENQRAEFCRRRNSLGITAAVMIEFL